MYARAVKFLLLALVFIFPQNTRAVQDGDPNALELLGVILVPGNPIISADIGWVDPATERYYIADRSNSGVDIIDAENHLWVGRVGGMAGPLPSNGGTTTTNGPGPNGVLVTPDKILWAGDGNSTVQVADVDPTSETYLSILGSISTNTPGCDDGTAHYCGRADELGYDPTDRVILIANNGPNSARAPHGSIAPYVTFIAADAPYAVLGSIEFPGAGGLEQPLWDDQLQRFLLTVPGRAGVIDPFVAVIDPIGMTVEKVYGFDCPTLAGNNSTSTTGIALGQNQTLLVSACGLPVIMDATNGAIINVVNQVGGGDEVWYNPGDDRFYVTGSDAATGAPSLGMIDGSSGNWILNVTDVRGRNPAAFPETNDVYTVVAVNQAIVDDPSLDDSTCAIFGFNGRGCIAVFDHPDAPELAHLKKPQKPRQ
jgi:hypothetical protein